MANRLADETSPYLLQHKDNPVDWHPWGEDALARAREEDRPILLSIGYSACHWCHVMERESFEDDATAGYMNERFVCIKLDREERPDLDAIYMEACQAMTGHGGWPLNVFLTPEQVPFYAGTYFPPDERGGMPSWRRVLDAVADAWARCGGGRGGHEEGRDPRRRRADRAAPPGRRAARPARGRDRPGEPRYGRRRPAPVVRPELRRLRGRAEVPTLLGHRVPPAPRRGGNDHGHAARDGVGRDVRPGRRRLCALLGRRPLARAPLREDALRQRLARPRFPARLAGDGRRPVPAGLRRDARLGAARDARPRGSVPLGARRGLRGRRGQVLRVEPRRAPRRAGRGRRRGDRILRRERRRELRGIEHPHAR